ncbi:hypothetical protein ACFFNY_07330 [Paenibacillus hodogayensis]|uniref:Uncharacterized protein n=1 Tax=Paenibacillus hodogayensis TaxID=279208 RepID=A0ABV5VSZ6_9BACL
MDKSHRENVAESAEERAAASVQRVQRARGNGGAKRAPATQTSLRTRRLVEADSIERADWAAPTRTSQLRKLPA